MSCSYFKTNVLGTFWSHYSKKHASLTYSSTKDEIRCPLAAADKHNTDDASDDTEQNTSELEHRSHVTASASAADYFD